MATSLYPAVAAIAFVLSTAGVDAASGTVRGSRSFAVPEAAPAEVLRAAPRVGSHDAAGSLAIRFTGNTLSVQVVPRATTYWYGLQVEPTPFRSRVWYLINLLSDDDGDGTVQWQLTRPPLQSNSIWAVVDSSGAYGVASPTATLVQRAAPTVERDANRRLNRLKIEAVSIDDVSVLWVRPELGAWTADVFSEGPTDVDGGTNATVTLTPSAFEPFLARQPRPDTFAAGDVFIVLFPEEAFSGALRSYAVLVVDPATAGVPIPTASSLALLLCAVILGAVGFFAIRRL